MNYNDYSLDFYGYPYGYYANYSMPCNGEGATVNAVFSNPVCSMGSSPEEAAMAAEQLDNTLACCATLRARPVPNAPCADMGNGTSQRLYSCQI